MGFRALFITLIACCFWIFSLMFAPTADALTKIKLSNLSYQKCPPELGEGIVSSDGASQEANCFLVSGRAKNGSGKTLYDADVFGRIYDANNSPVMQNRGRIGTLEEVPPGKSNFQIRITVPTVQPEPLKLDKFKASGFSARVRPYYYDD